MIWLGAGIALSLGVVRQCRKPSGWLGRLFAREMNGRHRALTAWGLSHATPGPNSIVLDVGCGGGRTVRELAQIAREGKVYGIDYAGASVAVARMVNAAAIDAGQVEVRRVVKPGGRALLIVESYRGKRFGMVDTVALRLIGGTTLSVEAHRDVLSVAGFSDIQVFEERGRGWLCVVGTKR